MLLEYQIACVLSQIVLAVAMDLIWVMFAFFVVVTMTFILIAIFYPEWVGITGNRAHEIQAHQQQEKLSDQLDTQNLTSSATQEKPTQEK